jgi:hypothetical protein
LRRVAALGSDNVKTASPGMQIFTTSQFTFADNFTVELVEFFAGVIC